MFYIQFSLNLDHSRIGKKETHVKLSPSMIHFLPVWGESREILNGRDIKHYENTQPFNNPPPQKKQKTKNKKQKVIE